MTDIFQSTSKTQYWNTGEHFQTKMLFSSICYMVMFFFFFVVLQLVFDATSLTVHDESTYGLWRYIMIEKVLICERHECREFHRNVIRILYDSSCISFLWDIQNVWETSRTFSWQTIVSWQTILFMQNL